MVTDKEIVSVFKKLQKNGDSVSNCKILKPHLKGLKAFQRICKKKPKISHSLRIFRLHRKQDIWKFQLSLDQNR